MAQEWYYVESNQRIGPVDHNEILSLIKQKKLDGESYIWTKGYDNWVKLNTVKDFFVESNEKSPDLLKRKKVIVDWENFPKDKKIFNIKIGTDRGTAENEYGPFNFYTLKKIADENRINCKTLLYVTGMDKWEFIGDLPIKERLFSDEENKIEEKDRRRETRRPFVARLLFHDKEYIYEGICRDISIGGMQILVPDFPGNVNEEISLNVHPENTGYCFVATGKIVRVLDGKQGFSIRFTNLDQEAKEAIQNYLGE